MFESVLIANRGEIARRVIRTLDRLGIASVAVYTSVDRGAPHVREAGQAIAIDSYLNIEAVMMACAEARADALHPGYGFLSENADLARACDAAGVVFIGPPPASGELMGDKVLAKELAIRAGVPVVPSFSESEVRAAPPATFPLLVKAAAGGGGRGMRVVERADDLDAALASARREALAGFGDERVFIERFLPQARHIEVQIIADTHGTILHLGERECSLQRRHQKVVEESPSPVVSPELRAQLGASAVALATTAGYVNAGTVEFIANMDDPSEHYFLEMNARLQVEHPVTELVCGLDLVELQLRVAAGERLPITQQDVQLRGHAIEARLNAEDATRDFLPAAGRILAYRRGGNARVDDAIEVGSVVETSYDSLLAKVIAYGEDRAEALAKLDRALAATSILGVTTTTGYVRSLLATDEVREGRIDTELIGRLPAPRSPRSDEQVARAAALLLLLDGSRRSAAADPFDRVDGWRLAGVPAAAWWRLAVGTGDPVDVCLDLGRDLEAEQLGPNRWRISMDGSEGEWTYAVSGDVVWVGEGGWAWAVRRVSAAQGREGVVDGELRAPMPGQVLLVPVAVGDAVLAGDPIVVLESMKMELVLAAPADGIVAALTVAVGDKVVVDQTVARVDS